MRTNGNERTAASDVEFRCVQGCLQYVTPPFKRSVASDTVDEIDRRILHELQADGRLSNIELADRVGLSPSPCLQRVKRLVEQGVIRRFAAIVDAEKVDRGLSVTIFADPTSNAPEAVERFEALVLAMKGTVDVRRMFGRPDYIITVETRDLASYEELYQTDLAKLREIAHIESHIPMRVLRDRTSPPEAT
jgi:Lrp/AsnC family transcriptional regulator, leucine-responsive regulatory protein